ncbi:MAG: biopolymer transporter ExbD [Candidatus Hydrothermia bacterium]|nr:biopolymer transporter ExbD [Candidatus Hydrothermia bacterium]
MAVKINFPKREIPSISFVSLANLALIIAVFMVIVVKIEYYEKSKVINLPKLNNSFKIPTQSKVSTILIVNDNEIYAEGFRIKSLDDLSTIYLMKSQKDISVLIKADKNVKVNTIIEVMDKLRQIGINKIAFITGG